MSAPYWGDLPGPKVGSSRQKQHTASGDFSTRIPRRTSLDTAAVVAQQPRSNRVSTQTNVTEAPTESTLSPYTSPTASYQGYALAPRPPSYGNYSSDMMEKRRRRASKNRDEYEEYTASGALSVAADAPKAPPLSYRHPYGNGGLPYTITKEVPAKQADIPPSPGCVDPDSYIGPVEKETKHASVQSDRRASSGSSVPTRIGSAGDAVQGYRKTSLGGEVDRRLFADTRSPLQKLELLTLDSITKEEKRARLEAAERNARERASRGTDKSQIHTPTVRFIDKDLESDLESPQAQILTDPISTPSIDQASQRVVRVQEPEQNSQRQASLHSRKSPGPRAGITTAVAQEDTNPQRNLSFRERAARQDIKTPHNGPESAATPPVTTPTGGYSLTRSGSNKLKKDPPGDPWYQRRVEAERKFNQVAVYQQPGPSQAQAEARESGTAAAPVAVGQSAGESMRNKVPPMNTAVPRRRPVQTVDDDESPVINGGYSANVAKQSQGPLAAQTPRHGPFPFAPDAVKQKGEVSTAAGVGPAALAAGTTAAVAARQYVTDDAHNDDLFDHEHHLFHHHEYKPGQGLYKPPRYLNEWKKGTVGTLSGTMLDLSDQMTPPMDKNQTWWETPPSQRRGSISSRPRRAEAFDGEYDETNGTQTPNDWADQTEGLLGSVGNRQSWSVYYDEVVPHARELLGHQATADKRKARRQSRLYSLGRSLASASEEEPPNCLSMLCSCLPYFSRGRLRQLSEHAILTRAARMTIRVPKFVAPTRFKPPLYLKCGPLLRYCGMRTERIASKSARTGPAVEREFWRGTIMIVTADDESSYDIAPTLRLFAQPIKLLPPPPAEVHGEVPPEYEDPVAGHPKLGRKGETCYVRPVHHLQEGKDHSKDDSDEGLFEKRRSPPDIDLSEGATEAPGSFADRKKKSPLDGEKLGKYKDVRGYRLHAERGYTFWRFSVEVELRDEEQRIAYRINRGPATGFWVPSKGQSMNIMFHSCNGFSLSVNPDELSGPDPLWRDVLNNHQSRPFHVMIGGGDQLYCDAVMRQTKHFQEWLMIRNPLHKHNAPFTAEMQDELEAFYLERYSMWFSQGLFGLANSQIPMVNMYDDHDIIDGFGSYPHHFMTSPVFSGLGNVAFKYYMLFQHQSVIDETEETESSWALGVKPGPYIHEKSRSLFMSLGSKIALLAVDCRTERMRDQVVKDQTWDKLMDRCYSEIIKGKTEHLLVLLGVPIAYPRLVWLENILTSRLLDPIKALGKTGLFGNVFNKFDGGVEVLDDLDDHWTAKNHKDERKIIIEDLQDLAADRSVRITILSGDVHLGAVGQFYSNPKLELAKHNDFRYMPNVISSAIVNTPPPDLMADVLNKRNKVHHLDKDTDEDMIPMFAHGVEGKPRNNKRLLPHRNWCSIREYMPGQTPPSTPPDSVLDGHSMDSAGAQGNGLIRKGITRRLSKRDRGPSYRADVIDSRPPVSTRGPGLFRTLSSRGRRSDSDVPGEGKQPKSGRRTLSLTRGDFSIFRRGSAKDRERSVPDDGGINGTWGDSDPENDSPEREQSRSSNGRILGAIGLRGGGGSYHEFSEGDDSYFTSRAPANTSAARPSHASKATRLLGEEAPPPLNSRGYYQPPGYGTTTTVMGPAQQARDSLRPKPFHRTPTSASAKLQRTRTSDVNIQGGLEICLNVEVSPKDPTGITVPYRLLVPRLWYDGAKNQDVEMPEHRVSGGVKRLLSLNRDKSNAGAKDKGRDGELARTAEWQQNGAGSRAAGPVPGTAF